MPWTFSDPKALIENRLAPVAQLAGSGAEPAA
jgi:hypothetical protein